MSRYENDPSPKEVVQVLRLGQGDIVLSGSVAVGLLEGYSFRGAIERANDIDMVLLPGTCLSLLPQIIVGAINSRHIKKINCFEQPPWVKDAKIRPQDITFLKTEEGRIPVETISRMIDWEIEYLKTIDIDSSPDLIELRGEKLRSKRVALLNCCRIC